MLELRLAPVRSSGSRLLAGLLLAGSGAILLSCADDLGLGAPEIDTVRVFPDSTDLRIGHAVQLQAVPMDERATFITGRTVTWSTDDPQVATVTEQGTVQGVGSGTVTITATVSGRSGSSRVRVQPAPAIGLSRSQVLLEKNADAGNPPPESIEIVNAGGFSLEGLDVGEVTFGAGAEDWLTAVIAESVAPATLVATFTAEAVTEVGEYTATIPVLSADASNSPSAVQVTLTVASGAPANASGSGDEQAAAVGTAVAVPPSVVITDAFGNPVQGVEVSFAVTAGGGEVGGAQQVTDSEGRAAVESWRLGTAVGVNTLVATPDAAGVDPVSFSATATAGAPARLEAVGGDGQSSPVATSVPVEPSVRVSDEFGNVLGGVTVMFAVTEGGGSATGTAAVTDAAGVAAVESWTLGTMVGENTLEATLEGVAETVHFTATAVAGAAATVELVAGGSQTGVVGSSVPVPPAVRVRDPYANAVEGFAVAFEVTGGGGSLTGATPTTDVDGIATVGSWTLGTGAGTNTLQAVAAGLSGSPVPFSATAVADAAVQIAAFAGNGQSAPIDTEVATPPAVRISDQHGNPVEGTAVFWEVTSGGGSVTGGTSESGPDGVARVGSWTLGTQVGANTLSATAAGDGLAGNPVTFTATGTVSGGTSPPDATESSVSAHPATIQASSGGSVATVTVTVRDQHQNLLPEASVSFAVTPSDGVGITQPVGTTDASGELSGTFHSTSPGTKTVTATINGSVVVEQTVEVTVEPGDPNTALSTLSASPGTLTANDDGSSTATLTAIVLDGFGNPVAGVEVVPSSSGSNNVFAPASAVSGANGEVAFTFRSTSAQAKTLSAAIAGVGTISQTASVTVGPAPLSLANSLVSATGTITASSGGSVAGVTVTARDAFGNPRSGHSVTITVSPTTGNTLTQPGGATNASGQASGSFYTTSAQTKTVSATIAGAGTVGPTATVTVNPGPASLTNSLVSATSPITASNIGATAATRSTVTATVRDAFGNPRSGHAVTLSVSGSNNAISQPASTTNASGQTSGSFRSTTAQTKTVTATISGVGAISQTPSVVVNAAAPASVVVENHGYSAGVGTSLLSAQRPTFTVRDAFSNPVPGTPVSYASTGGGSFTGAGTTNSQGSVTLSSWTLGGTAADDAFGRMANTATLFAGAASATATNYGIYRWASNVAPLVSGGTSCAGCHTFNRSPNTIVNVAPALAPCNSPTSNRRVVAGNANSSVLYRKLTTSPFCGGRMGSAGPNAGTFFSNAQLKIVRAWINNGAFNN